MAGLGMQGIRRWLLLGAAGMAVGCQSVPPTSVPTVADLDLERFMGDWYVIANIPTFLERDAHNAVESYQRDGESRVKTTFRFRDGAFDGPLKTFHPTGFVSEQSNAVWGMQFLWPFKAEYLVLYVDPDYRLTIIGRSKRDYIWFMARQPVIREADYDTMLEVARQAGYDTTEIQAVPQRWPEPASDDAT